ncbi:MAG: hypothetical protein CMI60_13695 [Parvibaculum sp.]|nr:hypothetical protein [Parvibaculum sp.]
MAKALRLKPLNLFVDPAIDLVDRRLKDLLAYWQDKRAERDMPARIDISPGDLVTHLPRLALLNVTTEEGEAPLFSVRLSGTGIDDLLGSDHRGAGLNDLLPSASAKLISAALGALVEHKRPMRFFAQARLPGNPAASVEGLALPLGVEGGPVNMVLIETVSIRQSDMAQFPDLEYQEFADVAS